jgi:hypothetical protein
VPTGEGVSDFVVKSSRAFLPVLKGCTSAGAAPGLDAVRPAILNQVSAAASLSG